MFLDSRDGSRTYIFWKNYISFLPDHMHKHEKNIGAVLVSVG